MDGFGGRFVKFAIALEVAKLMKQTEERHSESRMREIRTSGLMRGREVGSHWLCASQSVASLSTLLIARVGEGQGKRCGRAPGWQRCFRDLPGG